MIKWIQNTEIKKSFSNIPLIGILTLISLAFGVSTVFATDLMVSFKRYLYFLIESFVFYFIIISSIQNDDDIGKIIKTVIISLSVVALLGILQRYTGFDPTSLFGSGKAYDFELAATRYHDSNAITSTYDHRILFGTAMAVGSIIVLLYPSTDDRLTKRVLHVFLYGIMLSSLYFSFSRGPWLAFLIASGFIILTGNKPFIKKSLIFVGLFALLFVLRPGIQETIKALYDSTFQADTIKGASYQWRYIVFNKALTEVSKSIYHLFFGYGGGSHLFMKFDPVLLPTGHYGDFTSWDNEFAVTILEQGFVGLILLLFFYAKYFICSFYYFITEKKNRDYILISMACVLVIVFMKTNVKSFSPQMIYLEFIMIAIGASIYAKRINMQTKNDSACDPLTRNI